MPNTLFRRLFFELYYLRKPRWDTGISPPELQAFVQAHPAGRALDLGCGTGTNAIFLASQGWQVTGVDFVGGAIRQARRKAQQAGVVVDFRQGDVTRLDGLQPGIDLVLDIGCYHSLSADSQAAYLEQLSRLLAPGGTFLLYAMLRDPAGAANIGLTGQDEARLSSRLLLLDRQVGTDHSRPSAWFSFKKPTEGNGP